MTDERFTELVNLYFDQEISAENLKQLKSEIAACPDRKRAFTERCRLHKAMRVALNPEDPRSRRSSPSPSSRRSCLKSCASTGVSRYEESLRTSTVAQFPGWMLASGLAASVAIGMMLLPPVFRDTTDPQSQSALVGVSEKEFVEQDPIATLGKSELRRYAVLQQRREAKRYASLIAQMRLMGLRPEYTPEDKDLREVSLAANYKAKRTTSQAELFQRIQGQKAIPEQQLLRLEKVDYVSDPFFSTTFEPSLVSFGEL